MHLVQCIHSVKSATQHAPHDIGTWPEERIIGAQEKYLVAVSLWQCPRCGAVCLEPSCSVVWQKSAGEQPVLPERLDLHLFIEADWCHGIGIVEG